MHNSKEFKDLKSWQTKQLQHRVTVVLEVTFSEKNTSTSSRLIRFYITSDRKTEK